MFEMNLVVLFQGVEPDGPSTLVGFEPSSPCSTANSNGKSYPVENRRQFASGHVRASLYGVRRSTPAAITTDRNWERRSSTGLLTFEFGSKEPLLTNALHGHSHELTA